MHQSQPTFAGDINGATYFSRPHRLKKTSSKQSKRRDLCISSDYIVRQTVIHFVNVKVVYEKYLIM